MTLVALFPSYEVFRDQDIEQQSWEIAKAYGFCQGWRLNLAVNQSGSSFGETGSSDDISNDIDRAVLGKLRSMSDVIVTSGATARVERYRSSRHAPIAIFTESGDLEDVPALQGQQFFTPLVVTPDNSLSKVERSLSDVDVKLLSYSDKNQNWPTSVATVIKQEGYQSPILESGLNTLRAFIDSGVVSEICLTITHQNLGVASARELGDSWIGSLLGSISEFTLANVFTSNGTIFARWRRGS